MASPKKNIFSNHILQSTDEEADAGLKPQRSPVVVEPAAKRLTSTTKATVNRASTPEATNKREDYRKARARNEGRKFINILIAEELQSEIRPRMMTRKLTWEMLIEGLLRDWLKKNPGFRPD